MQNYPSYSIDHTRSDSPYEPEKKTSIIKRSTLVLFIVAIILVITLIVSIILVFTIGLKAAQRTVSPIENTLVNPVYEPCMCGCPSIEPSFNDGTKVTSRIVNGESARANSWPWQMLLMIIDRNQTPISLCGATLFTDRHILTAAHCVHQTFPPLIFLFAGQHTLNINIPLRSGYPVRHIYIHEGYNAFLQHDIAILTIDQPIRFDSSIYPICLATPSSAVLKANEELVTIGWGRTSGQPNNAMSLPHNLQQVKLAYIPTSHPNCSDLFRQTIGDHPGQMCAGKPSYNVCQGDSGGPLMRRTRKLHSETYYWEQIGIASATVDCGWNSTSPDIFINVPYYYDWIMATVKRAV